MHNKKTKAAILYCNKIAKHKKCKNFNNFAPNWFQKFAIWILALFRFDMKLRKQKLEDGGNGIGNEHDAIKRCSMYGMTRLD